MSERPLPERMTDDGRLGTRAESSASAGAPAPPRSGSGRIGKPERIFLEAFAHAYSPRVRLHDDYDQDPTEEGDQ